MEFLPLETHGERVYAWFWLRFAASFVDVLALAPFALVLFFIERFAVFTLILSAVVSAFMYSVYSIFFHYKYGATLGKMSVNIKVTRPNGDRLSFGQAWLRSVADLLFAVVFILAYVTAILRAEAELLLSYGWLERSNYTNSLMPDWYSMFTTLSIIWVTCEVIVLISNNRKRALHDFIAGTVVIREKHAMPTNYPDPTTM